MHVKAGFKWGEPATYCVLERDGQTLHLCLKENRRPGAVYLFTEEIEGMFDELKSKGADIRGEIQTMEWG